MVVENIYRCRIFPYVHCILAAFNNPVGFGNIQKSFEHKEDLETWRPKDLGTLRPGGFETCYIKPTFCSVMAFLTASLMFYSL